MCFDSTLISSQFENIKVPVPSLGCSANASKDVSLDVSKDVSKDVVDNKPPIDNQPAVLPDGDITVSKKDSTTEESKEVVAEVKTDSGETLKTDSVSVPESASNQV